MDRQDATDKMTHNSLYLYSIQLFLQNCMDGNA